MSNKMDDDNELSPFASQTWSYSSNNIPPRTLDEMRDKFGINMGTKDETWSVTPDLNDLGFLLIVNRDGSATSRITCPVPFMIYALRAVADSLEMELIEKGEGRQMERPEP